MHQCPAHFSWLATAFFLNTQAKTQPPDLSGRFRILYSQITSYSWRI